MEPNAHGELAREWCAYTPFYCEENIWHLAGDVRLPSGSRHVALISNAARQTAVFEQRAAPPGVPVLWDYHVVLIVEAAGGPLVFDLDSRLRFPAPLVAYVQATFGDQRRLPAEVRAVFRVVDAPTWLARFDSDRAHMRLADGTYSQPPPAWPMIRAPADAPPWSLVEALDFRRSAPGMLVDVEGLLSRFGA